MDPFLFMLSIYAAGVVTGLLIPALLKWMATPKNKRRRDDRRDDRGYSRPRSKRRPRGRDWR